MIELIGIAILSIIFYYLYFWKIDFTKDFRLKDGKKSYVRAKEIPPVYPNGWFALLESHELANGQVKYVAALGEHFAVFRTEKGFVNIIDAFCPHLGANIGIGGVVKGDCVECPFHSWKFDGDGKCRDIPYTSSVPPGLKIKHWQSREVNRRIFVWYHAESLDPDWEIEPIPQVNNGVWCIQGRNKYIVTSHVQEIPENGADWTHLGVVHVPAMFLGTISPNLICHEWTGNGWTPPEQTDYMINNSAIKSTHTENSEMEESFNKSHQLSSAQNDNDSVLQGNSQKNNHDYPFKIYRKHQATFHLIHTIKLLKKWSFLQLEVNGAQVGPGYVVLHVNTKFGRLCILETVTPIEPLVQKVTHVMFAPFFMSPYAKLIFYGMSEMFERDILVWNNKIYLKNPILLKEEKRIAQFRRWFSQFYSSNSPTYKSTTSLDW